MTPSFCSAAPSGCRFCHLGNLTFGLKEFCILCFWSWEAGTGLHRPPLHPLASAQTICQGVLDRWGAPIRDNAGKGSPRVSQAYLCFRFSLSDLYNENQCRTRPKLTKGPTPLPLKIGGYLWTSSASLQKVVTVAHSLLLGAVQWPRSSPGSLTPPQGYSH